MRWHDSIKLMLALSTKENIRQNKMAAQLKCSIYGGPRAVNIIKAVDIREEKNNYLSVLSKELSSLQDSVNHTLSELVDEEKMMDRATGRVHCSDEGINVYTCTVMHYFLCRY